MPSPAFTLQVSAASSFRKLLSEAAGRYVEIVGGSAPERDALSRVVAERVEALAHGADGAIEIACTRALNGVDVSLRAGGQTVVVHQPLTTAGS